jgi:hypothetical protein
MLLRYSDRSKRHSDAAITQDVVSRVIMPQRPHAG